MKNNKLDLVLVKLRADYAAQLPGTVTQMEDLWRRLAAAELPLSKLAELVRMAHSIAGSGTTFGRPSASRVASELESLLDRFGGSGRLPSPAEQETVSALLAALRQTAAEP